MKKKKKKVSKLRQKIKMYDMIVGNMIAGDNVIEPEEQLDRAHLSIGYSNIASNEYITKYYIINEYPDWLQPSILDKIRSSCILPGIKINFFMYGQPHTINWDSQEMINKVDIWAKYSKETNSNINAFEYRGKKRAVEVKERLINSTMYLNVAELDYKRTLSKVSIVIQITCERNMESLINMNATTAKFKKILKYNGLKVRELKINMIDWLSTIGIFALRGVKETTNKMTKKIMTDDLIACLGGYKQGRIGEEGVPIGIDVNRKELVLYKFKDDPNKVENWLISAISGGGKSYFVKSILLWLIASGFTVTIMDYEGDEYTDFAAFIAESNPEDVKVVSMGKGSAVYVDPMEIPELTGDADIDDDLKEIAMNYILGTYRIMVCGTKGELDKWQESVISTAIKRVYEERGVTEDKSTWHRSKGLRIRQVYEEIEIMVDAKEFVDDSMDNVKHKAAMVILESCRAYFEEGETKAGAFKKPMSLNELHKAKLIVFSFGVKGATSSSLDPTVLALKQLSVANISTQISNHCKYVKHSFNVKVWEEYQRYGDVPGSAEIIGNSMTGGRKRGDINFIITNDLAAILDDNNPINKQIRQNISTYSIGKIKDKDTISEFCSKFQLTEVEDTLRKIAKAAAGKNTNRKKSKYSFSFCVMFDDDKKAAVKSMLPKAMASSKLFSTGVKKSVDTDK